MKFLVEFSFRDFRKGCEVLAQLGLIREGELSSQFELHFSRLEHLEEMRDLLCDAGVEFEVEAV